MAEEFDPLKYIAEKAVDGWSLKLDSDRSVSVLKFPHTFVIQVRRKEVDADKGDDIDPKMPILKDGEIYYGMRLTPEATEALYTLLSKVMDKTKPVSIWTKVTETISGVSKDKMRWITDIPESAASDKLLPEVASNNASNRA